MIPADRRAVATEQNLAGNAERERERERERIGEKRREKTKQKTTGTSGRFMEISL